MLMGTKDFMIIIIMKTKNFKVITIIITNAIGKTIIIIQFKTDQIIRVITIMILILEISSLGITKIKIT